MKWLSRVIDLRQFGFLLWMLAGALLGGLLGLWLQSLTMPLLHIKPQYAAYVGMAVVAIETVAALLLANAAYAALFDPYRPAAIKQQRAQLDGSTGSYEAEVMAYTGQTERLEV